MGGSIVDNPSFRQWIYDVTNVECGLSAVDRHLATAGGGFNRSVDIAAQIVSNPLCTPAPGGAILYPNEP